MLVTLLLLACNSDGMPACPSAPGGDPGASLLAERSIDTLGDAVPDQIEVFHDQEPLNAWWASTWLHENAPEMDFTSAQAVGLVTEFDLDNPNGELIKDIVWESAAEEAMVARLERFCGNGGGASSEMWTVWTTPIAPVNICLLGPCDE